MASGRPRRTLYHGDHTRAGRDLLELLTGASVQPAGLGRCSVHSSPTRSKVIVSFWDRSVGSQQKKEVLHSQISSAFFWPFFFFREKMVNSLRPKRPEWLFPLHTQKRVLLGTGSWLAVFPTPEGSCMWFHCLSASSVASEKSVVLLILAF